LNNSFIRSKKIKKHQIFIKKELDQPQPSDIIFMKVQHVVFFIEICFLIKI